MQVYVLHVMHIQNIGLNVNIVPIFWYIYHKNVLMVFIICTTILFWPYPFLCLGRYHIQIMDILFLSETLQVIFLKILPKKAHFIWGYKPI